ncbi:MAG: YfaP family protein [Planctomycetaceae bacterium]
MPPEARRLDEACGDESGPDLELAVVPPVRRRPPWSVQPFPPAVIAPSPVNLAPAVATLAPPADVDVDLDAPEIESAGAETPAGWPDRRWWTSTTISTVVHVVVLTILALIVPTPEQARRPRPFEIVQPAPEPEPAEFAEPEELAAVEIEPPDAFDPAAEPVPVDVAVDAADAEAAAFGEPDVDVGVMEIDAAGLVARIGGGAGGAAGAGRGAGFGGDVGRRLAAAGAKTGEVQVSLSWDNFNDIDLHVVAPSGERIFFGHRVSRCRGRLDVDMNALGPQSREPVENVFWPLRRAPPGEYRVFVHHYGRFDPTHDETTFTVHVLVNGRKRRFTGSVKSGDPPVPVTVFRKGAADESDDEFVE